MSKAVASMSASARASATIADVLAATAEEMKTSHTTYGRSYLHLGDNNEIIRTRRQVSAYEAMIEDMGTEMLAISGFSDVARHINPNRQLDVAKPSEDQGIEWLNQMLMKAQQFAEEQARIYSRGSNPVSFQMRDTSEFVDSMKHVALSLDLGADAVYAFQKNLLDMFLELYKQANKMDVERRFSQSHGLAYNPQEQEMRNLQDFVVRLGTFEGDSLTQIVQAQEELRNLNRGKIQGVRRKEDGTEEYFDYDVNMPGLSTQDRARAEQEIAKKRRQLELQIEAFRTDLGRIKDEAFSLGQLFPDGPEREKVISELNRLFSADLSDAQVLRGVSQIFSERFEQQQRIDTQNKLALQNSQQQLAVVQRMNEVESMRLDLITSVTARARLREQLARNELAAQIKDLDVQREKGAISVQDYVLRRKQLEDESQLNAIYERRQVYQQGIVDLYNQEKETLTGMLSGVQSTLGDLSIWGALVNSNGEGEFKEKLRTAIAGVLEPFASTFYKRVVDNFMTSIQRMVMNNSALRNVLGSPETTMKADIVEAFNLAQQPIETAITNGSNIGAQAMYDNIVRGGQAAASAIAGAFPAPVPFSSDIEGAPVPGAPPRSGQQFGGQQAYRDTSWMSRAEQLLGGGAGDPHPKPNDIPWLPRWLNRALGRAPRTRVDIGPIQTLPTAHVYHMTEEQKALIQQARNASNISSMRGLVVGDALPTPAGIDTALNRRLYHAIQPYGYDSKNVLQSETDSEANTDRISRAMQALRGEDPGPRAMAVPRREDAWLTYLGLPQVNGTLTTAKYTPGQRDPNDNIRILDMPGFFDRHVEGVAASNPGTTAATFIRDVLDMVNHDPDRRYLDTDSEVMGTFKWGAGSDERGPYVSYYDRWDLDGNPVEGKNGRYGRPYDIYGRVHYDPRTHEPIKDTPAPTGSRRSAGGIDWSNPLFAELQAMGGEARFPGPTDPILSVLARNGGINKGAIVPGLTPDWQDTMMNKAGIVASAQLSNRKQMMLAPLVATAA
jgi:hypothetical protein